MQWQAIGEARAKVGLSDHRPRCLATNRANLAPGATKFYHSASPSFVLVTNLITHPSTNSADTLYPTVR